MESVRQHFILGVLFGPSSMQSVKADGHACAILPVFAMDQGAGSNCRDRQAHHVIDVSAKYLIGSRYWKPLHGHAQGFCRVVAAFAFQVELDHVRDADGFEIRESRGIGLAAAIDVQVLVHDSKIRNAVRRGRRGATGQKHGNQDRDVKFHIEFVLGMLLVMG